MNDGGTIQHSRSCVSPIAITSGGRSRCAVDDAVQIDLGAHAARRAQLRAAAHEAARAEILEAGLEPALAQLRETAYDARMITFLRNGSGT